MKSMFLRTSLALACALSLAACGGGGSGNLLLGGSVSGLTKNGLVLQNNGGPELTLNAGVTSFSFPDLIENDTEFNITIKQPQPVGVTCEVINGKGKSGQFNVTSVIVSCVGIPHALGGTVRGLKGSGLVVVNGSDQKQIAANGAFNMTQVPDGAPYGITVLAQPAGQACTVQNGTGTMGATDVTNVVVDCI